MCNALAVIASAFSSPELLLTPFISAELCSADVNVNTMAAMRCRVSTMSAVVPILQNEPQVGTAVIASAFSLPTHLLAIDIAV